MQIHRNIKKHARSDLKYFFLIYSKQRLSKCLHQDAGLTNSEAIDRFARYLEQLLLFTSPTDEHDDADTSDQALNNRLARLLATVLRRRALREQEPETHRLEEFQRVLGARRVQEIDRVCQEIDRVKLERANVCVTLCGKMPEAVRKFYFGTRLPDLWKCETNSVNSNKWDPLYDQAVQNLKAYREFMSKQI
jgi:hypothetical protein